MGELFGTDGYRGKFGEKLTALDAFKIGRFLGWHQKRLNGSAKTVRVVIGKDTRRSSYALEYALSAGLNSSGADAYLMHVTTTPSVAFVAKTEGFDYGIMISASHNPYYDNGIKIISNLGEKVSEELTDLIEDYLLSRGEFCGAELPFSTHEKVGKTVDYLYGRSKYAGYLLSTVVKPFGGIRVVLDCANGGAYKLARSTFESLGAKVTVINGEPNGFNINENCGSTDLSALKAEVVKLGADIGFAYDGDADRCLCVNAFGEEIDGDKIIYLLARRLQEKGELLSGKVVATVMSNLGLKESLSKIGIGLEVTAVGDRFVYEKMKNSSIEIGGETSGHIIFTKYATTGDGILTSLKITEALTTDRDWFYKTLSEIKIYPQVIKNVRVKDKQKIVAEKSVIDAVKLAQTFLGACGRIVVRPSGTEPVVRIMAEASEKCDCFTAIDIVEEEILKADG